MKTDRELPGCYRERREDRTAVVATARIRRNAWYSVEVRVRDVSQCGFMAECGDAIAIGSYIVLDVPGVGPVRAQVRWQIGGRMGGLFVDPISLEHCEWTAVKADPPPEAI